MKAKRYSLTCEMYEDIDGDYVPACDYDELSRKLTKTEVERNNWQRQYSALLDDFKDLRDGELPELREKLALAKLLVQRLPCLCGELRCDRCQFLHGPYVESKTRVELDAQIIAAGTTVQKDICEHGHTPWYCPTCGLEAKDSASVEWNYSRAMCREDLQVPRIVSIPSKIEDCPRCSNSEECHKAGHCLDWVEFIEN